VDRESILCTNITGAPAAPRTNGSSDEKWSGKIHQNGELVEHSHNNPCTITELTDLDCLDCDASRTCSRKLFAQGPYYGMKGGLDLSR
jgi:hypothetical protein